MKEREAIRLMPPAEVANLEVALRKHPDDRDTRRKLLEYYSVSRGAQYAEGRRRHILWLVENHPESELLGQRGEIVPEARSLWLKAITGKSTSPETLVNAASYLMRTDNALAEELLLRAHAVRPEMNVSSKLGVLYAYAIVGADPVAAKKAKAKLSVSSDPIILRHAGYALNPPPRAKGDLHSEHRSLGLTYLERSIELDPQSWTTQEFVQMLKAAEARQIKYSLPFRESFDDAAKLPEPERLLWLAQVAQSAYLHGATDSRAEHFALARKCVDEVLRLAPTSTNDPNYSRAVLAANLISGLFAMHDGDRGRAVRHMQAATEVPPADYLAQYSEFAAHRLAAWLLKDGERQTVIAFLERLAAMPHAPKTSISEAIEDIRKGFKPRWYPV